MTIEKLYAQLYKLLDQGETVYLHSEYQADGSITRSLSAFDDPRNLLGADEALEDSDVMTSAKAKVASPLTSYSQADDSLIVTERFMARPRLIILGGGHISLALADLSHLIGFDTIIYDDRPSFASTDRFPTAREVICDSYLNLRNHIEFSPSDFVVNVTRGHQHDKECLEGILRGQEPAYTGMIGSRRKAVLVLQQLEQEGYSPEKLERIHTPVGLDIGAQTPAEIAISIIAQIIEVKRTQQGKARWLSGDLELVEQVVEAGFIPEAVITVLSIQGSVPTEVGCKLGMTMQGDIAGTIGGGCSENEAISIGREVIRTGGWKLFDVDLSKLPEDEGMVCGGTMQVLIEKV